MYTEKVSDEIIRYCKDQVEKYNFARRGYDDGDKEQQLTGVIGQCMIMKYFDVGLIDGTKGFDGGIDIIYHDKKIDVKTMGRNTKVEEWYTNNFHAAQDCFCPDIYIFCSYNKKTQELTICGYVTREEFIQRRKFIPKGMPRMKGGTTFEFAYDMYEIDNTELNKINELCDLLDI